jgi:uncharacterized protein (DUF1501 family)
MDRRDFLSKTGIITAGALLVPSFLKANLFSSHLNLTKKRLVVIQLSGGNDGLNAVVPYGMDEYYQNRSVLGIAQSELLKIDHTFGFNSKLKGLHHHLIDQIKNLVSLFG